MRDSGHDIPAEGPDMVGVSTVTVLLVLIIVLLCTPAKDRPRTLRYALFLAALGAAIRYVVPTVLVFGWWLVTQHTWWVVGFFLVAVYGGAFARVLWLDANDRQALRSGSEVVFEQWVERYVTSFGYSREKAIETAVRVRDRK